MAADLDAITGLIGKDGVYIVDLGEGSFQISGEPHYDEIYDFIAQKVKDLDKKTFEAFFENIKNQLKDKKWSNEEVKLPDMQFDVAFSSI